jgi:hypothetical protein
MPCSRRKRALQSPTNSSIDDLQEPLRAKAQRFLVALQSADLRPRLAGSRTGCPGDAR